MGTGLRARSRKNVSSGGSRSQLRFSRCFQQSSFDFRDVRMSSLSHGSAFGISPRRLCWLGVEPWLFRKLNDAVWLLFIDIFAKMAMTLMMRYLPSSDFAMLKEALINKWCPPRCDYIGLCILTILQSKGFGVTHLSFSIIFDDARLLHYSDRKMRALQLHRLAGDQSHRLALVLCVFASFRRLHHWFHLAL